MKIRRYILLIVFGLLLIPQAHFAQNNPSKPPVKTPDDDLGDVTDEYQEYFFEALKQNGIENYERSITALLKCIELNDSESVVYFQLAKNYIALKNFGDAEKSLKKAITKEPQNEWYLDELYGVYYQLNDYDNALKTVKQLVKFHPDYKEDLASLYIRNKKYKEALKLIDELDKALGVSVSRDAMRNEIYNATGNDDDRIVNLETRIRNNPSNESNYLNLIYRYSEQGNKKKAYETATRLLKQKPNSHLVHLALYKFYLDDNKATEAIKSMKIVLRSTKVKSETKAKILNDFVKFVEKNPQYENDLLRVTANDVDDETGKSYAELGTFYLQKGDKVKALENFELALTKDNVNFGIIRNTALLQIDLGKYNEILPLVKEAIEAYPSQPILYLLNGVAFNHLNRHKDAITILEEGIDYVIDNIKMESDFYKQLSIAYKKNNNITKSRAFAKKAEQLQIKQ